MDPQNHLKTTLISLGLSEKEADVYLALLPRGQAPASTVAKALGIPRSSARFTLEQLVKRGIITENEQHNTTIYIIDTPDTLKFLVNHQREELEYKASVLDRMLGEMKKLHNPSSLLPKIKFYEGIDSAMQMAKEFIGDGVELFRVFGARDFVETHAIDASRRMDAYRDYAQKRVKKLQVIRSAQAKGRITSQPNYAVKVLPKLSELKVEIQILPTRVLIISFEPNNYSAVMIEHEAVAKALCDIFDQIWNQAEEL